ncbi:twin-arginine translocase subunit TatC [Deinococcus misasensis]|uniref:twin-arginine translocase subunit TatC n=1 Tax=Deinococcus misasensis TaxID=392413 RepID=UPI00054E13C4|nr:twin-arginine translocase subunit TatC [Deinococcus misasensis]
MSKTPANAEAPLLEHLEELRIRIFWALGFWIVGSGVAWNYRANIIDFLQYPLSFTKTNSNLMVTQVTDQLFMSFSIAMWGGLIVSFPFILHQIWLFVAPGLYDNERKWSIPMILWALSAFLTGTAFCYYVFLPKALPFMIDFLGAGLDVSFVVNLNLGQYIGQMLSYLLTFGLAFELPILTFVLARLGIVTYQLLASWRRYAVVVLLILAAVITPTPDPVNMLMLAVPLYVLYELGILLARMGKPKTQENAVEQ